MKILTLYASQTGNAENIAKNIASTAPENKHENLGCFFLDEFAKFWPILTEPAADLRVVLVSSTTGDGDAPDNSLKWWRHIRKNAAPGVLSHVKFTLCGLGDTNYSNFGAHPKKLEKKFLELGATSFYPKVIADEVEGLENAITPWIDGLWRCLAGTETAETVALEASPQVNAQTNEESQIDARLSALKLSALALPYASLDAVETLTNVTKVPASLCKVAIHSASSLVKSKSWPEYCASVCVSDAAVTFSQKSTFLSTIKSVECLSTKDAVKRTLLLEFDIAEMKWAYNAGDAFGLLTHNRPITVARILARLSYHPESLVEISEVDGATDKSLVPSHLPEQCTVLDLFTYHLDVCTVKKNLLRMLSEYAAELSEKKMLLFLTSKQGAVEYKRILGLGTDVSDILEAFPSCRPPLSRILDCLGPIQPRYYSACSADAEGKSIKAAFNVVKYDVDGLGEKEGLCTTMLDELTGHVEAPATLNERQRVDLSDGAVVALFPRPTNDFVAPEDKSVPIIMVGPGTGVAPFVGFCESRQQQQLVHGTGGGEWWLLYGCRDPARDFLFKQQLSLFKASGILNKLLVSYSRFQGPAGDEDVDVCVPGAKYVQDIVTRYAKDIVDLMLHKNARLYICGDAKGMAQDVNAALIAALVSEGNLSQEQALNLTMQWMQAKRYLKDIWG